MYTHIELLLFADSSIWFKALLSVLYMRSLYTYPADDIISNYNKNLYKWG